MKNFYVLLSFMMSVSFVCASASEWESKLQQNEKERFFVHSMLFDYHDWVRFACKTQVKNILSDVSEKDAGLVATACVAFMQKGMEVELERLTAEKEKLQQCSKGYMWYTLPGKFFPGKCSSKP